jgi:elongation factor G
VLRRVCVRGEALPALCGASLKGKGLEPLLDAMIAFLPSPLDRPKPGTYCQTPLSHVYQSSF